MTTRLEHTSTTTVGLTNARTRIVGDRTGPAADAVVAMVRVLRVARKGLARAFGRVAEVVTPLGWTMLCVVPAAFLVGYRFGWVELVAVAYAGLILIAVAVVYLVGRSSVTITLALRHSRVVVGQPARGVLVATNPTRHRVAASAVEVPVDREIVALSTPSLAREGEYEQEFGIPTARRGVYRVGPARTVRADPVGLVRREIVLTAPSELFVHPRTIAIPGTSTGLVRDLEGQSTRDLTSSDIAFHALREYTPGDEQRYIHWKSTAKTGTYMVRQFEETRRSRLVVALSLSSAEYATADEFEMAVSAAGTLGIRAIRDARDISVVVGENTPEFAKRKVLGIRQLNSLSKSRLLDDLSGVEMAESSLTIPDVARVAADKVPGISVAYLVCGSRVTATALRAASVQFRTGVEVVAVVCDPETVPGLRRVSDLSVLTIGYLDDLKASLARAAAV
ncbi:MAG: hypothetical protein RI885_2318 [Actinomycetota bacterium]